MSKTTVTAAREREQEMLKINNANNFRRTALGLCLIAGPLVALIGGLLTPWEKSDTTAAYLTALADNPARAQASAVLLYFGYLLMAVGIVGLFLLVLALWRAGFVPLRTPVVLFVGTAVSFVGPPNAVFFTIGTAAWLVALGHVGTKMLGMTDEEWERGEAPVREGADPVADARVA